MSPPEPEKRPTAFVSYAQSSKKWQKRVLDFTTALRDPGGVDAELDLFHGADHQRWADFGSHLIEESDFTLIAVDAAYRRRWMGSEKKGIGAGAAREAATIKAIFEADQKDFVRRVKVVLLPGSDEDDIPEVLRGQCEWFRIDAFDEEGLEPLLRSLWGRPAFPKPPLGPIPSLPPKAIANLKGEGDASGTGESPSAIDEVKLRGRLKGVQVRLERARSAPVRSKSAKREAAGLKHERDALEVSLEALADAQTPLPPRSERIRPQKPSRKTARQRASQRQIAVAATVGIACVVLLIVTDGGGTPSQPISAAAGRLRLQAPSGWTQESGIPRIGRLKLRHPINLASSDGRGGVAVAGVSATKGPTLLPADYRRQINHGTHRTAVGLGSLQAYRYEGLQSPDNGDPVTIYAAPTSVGVATLACRIPNGEAGRVASLRCAQIAATMRLIKGDAYQLGPSVALARVLRRRLSRLTKRRKLAMSKLNQASDAEQQAAAAESMAAAFHKASRGIAAVRISPESAPARRRLLEALGAARGAYNSLAVGARNESQSRYSGAAKAAEHAEQALARRIESMKTLGYTVGPRVS